MSDKYRETSDYHMNQQFLNPYRELPSDKKVRTTIDVALSTHAKIHSLHGRSGTLQTTINILLEKTINALESNGITCFDPDEYEHFILNSTLVAPGQRSAASSGQTASGNDGCGTVRVAQHPAPAPAVSNARVPHPNRRSKAKKSVVGQTSGH
jgi:hypothetical protein